MVIAIHSPSGTCTISAEGDIKFVPTTASVPFFTPCTVNKWDEHQISITHSGHMRIVIGYVRAPLSSGEIRMKCTQGASGWMRISDDNPQGQAEYSCPPGGEVVYQEIG